MKTTDKNEKKPTLTERITQKAIAIYEYCWTGVWKADKDTLGIRIIKIINLSVRSFLDRGLQWKSMALTYSTVLAIVPALALLLAIGRGFGFQNIIQGFIYRFFPAQTEAISTGLGFVDSYLKQASSGLFVGVGLIVLLWTLISLLSSIEQAFNMIWDIKRNRGIFQQVTDYIAICLIIPILIVCSAGVSIFMSALIANGTDGTIFSPIANIALEASPVILIWLAFSFSFCLIPNTKVQFKYAAISGAICAIVFQILQLLFVNGQLYVSKYNAIYGSFSFLPLLLIWLQLSWLILLFGCVLTYSMQNVLSFNFMGDLSTVSNSYIRKIELVVYTVIVKRFNNGEKPLSANDISICYDLPIRIVNRICESLVTAGLTYPVLSKKQVITYAPAVNAETVTVGDLFRRLDALGQSNFIPHFKEKFPGISKEMEELSTANYANADKVTVASLEMPEDTSSCRKSD